MNKKKNKKTKRKITNITNDINVPNTIKPSKLIIVISIIIVVMVLLIFRVGYLQFVNGSRLQNLATSQQTLTETISAKRGTIYDVKGNALAQNVSSLQLAMIQIKFILLQKILKMKINLILHNI